MNSAHAVTGIYLDHHATTPLDPRVLESMLPWLVENVGNAASTSHAFGRRAADVVAAARNTIAECLRVQPDEIIFTSGATEANNLAVKGVMQAHRHGRLIVNRAEHRSVLDPARRLRRDGFDVAVVEVDRTARVDPDSVARALTDDTRLVSVMLANNEVGTRNPVENVAAICQERGVPVHCDASQAIGRITVDATRLGADLVSLTAHKIYGPMGVGALIVRRTGDERVPLAPQIDGGGHEQGLRSGTLPVALIVGFARAMELAIADLETDAERIKVLREALAAAIQSRLTGMVRHGDPEGVLPGNLNLGFEGVDGAALMIGAAERGLAVSSGSACSSANPEPSHVLLAMGVSEPLARASLRFGLGRTTTQKDITAAVEIVCDVVTALR